VFYRGLFPGPSTSQGRCSRSRKRFPRIRGRGRALSIFWIGGTLVTGMRDVVEFCLRFLFLSVSNNRWLRWFLEAAFVIVAVGLVSVLGKDADLLMPFGITALDLTYLASLGVLLFVLALVFVSVIGIPLFRYNGVLLILAGIGVLEYQVYEYMKLGWWQSFPLRDFTDALFVTWTLDQSTGWPAVLLRNFLEETALSIFLIAIGALWHVIAKQLLDNALQEIRAVESERSTPVEETVAAFEPATSPSHSDSIVTEPIVLTKAKLVRPVRPAHDSSITPPWLADERGDTRAQAGVAELDSRRRPAGK